MGPNFVIKKAFDEGTASPFVARLFYGILKIRNSSVKLEDQGRFDKEYDKVYKPLWACRKSVFKATELLDNYLASIDAGETINITGSGFEVKNCIDDKLQDEFNSFMNNGVRAFKSVQDLTKRFDLDTSLMYGKESKFIVEIENIKKKDATLADCLEQNHYCWAANFIQLRNEMEHDGWHLDEICFHLSPNSMGIEIAIPQIMGMHFLEYMKIILCQLSSYIEDVLVHCMKTMIKRPFLVYEIPEEFRNPANPIRFDITIEGFSTTRPWEICYVSGDRAFLQKG